MHTRNSAPHEYKDEDPAPKETFWQALRKSSSRGPGTGIWAPRNRQEDEEVEGVDDQTQRLAQMAKGIFPSFMTLQYRPRLQQGKGNLDDDIIADSYLQGLFHHTLSSSPAGTTQNEAQPLKNLSLVQWRETRSALVNLLSLINSVVKVVHSQLDGP